MFLIPDEVLDLLPAEVGLALLVHHQVAEDQEEAVAAEVKAPPEVTTGNAGLPPVILGHLTHPRLGLDRIEQACNGEPDHRGEHESGDLVFDHSALAAAVGFARDVDETGQEEHRPEPATFHKPLIDKIVRICKVAPEIDYLYQSLRIFPIFENILRNDSCSTIYFVCFTCFELEFYNHLQR